MLTLTSCVLRSDRTESVWMTTDLLKFLVHSIRLLKKKLMRLVKARETERANNWPNRLDIYIYI